MINSHDSIYANYAGMTLNWLPMDTQELYNINKQKNIDLLEINGWLNTPFTYKFNSNGFRCNEFIDTQSLIVIGCSFTIGIGVPIDKTWGYFVGKELNLECYNLGQGAGSSDDAFRLGHYYIPKLKPKIVIFLRPDSQRYSYLTEDQIFMCGSWNTNEYYKTYISNSANGYLNKEKNTLALQMICNLHNIKFLVYDALSIPFRDLGRDLAHPGIKTNFEFSRNVLADI